MTADPIRLYITTPEHWEGGASQNVSLEPGGARIDRLGPGCRGVLISPPQDCLEEETVWHRMLIDALLPDGAGLELSVYASDSRHLLLEEGAVDLYEYIADASIPAEEKVSAFLPYRMTHRITPSDQLLHDVKGRYLWFALTMIGQEQLSPLVQEITLVFPRQSLVSYLPEVYQEADTQDDFLTRFLSIFGVFFEDMDQQIESVAKLLDTDINAEEMLRWMSGWLSVEDAALWREDRLRELMRNAVRLYRIRGTPQSIVEIVGIYTGRQPLLVEAIDTILQAEESSSEIAGGLRRLYGEDPSGFAVLVSEADVPTERSVLELGRILESFRPAHTTARLVVLRPYIFLDQHTYLGKNTWLSATKELSLDGFGTLPYVALLHDRQEQGNQHEKGWQDG